MTTAHAHSVSRRRTSYSLPVSTTRAGSFAYGTSGGRSGRPARPRCAFVTDTSRTASRPAAATILVMSTTSRETRPRDTLGRPIHDLRISVTDRCNFRCTYCMPREVYGRDFAFLPRAELLTFEEITRLAGIFGSLGAGKVRLTGGEPL